MVDAKPGKAYKEGDESLSVNTLDPVDGKENHKGDQIEGTFHVHIEGNGRTFDPKPSPQDKTASVNRDKLQGVKGNNYVLSPEYNKVYIYKNVNGTGQTIATISLNAFLNYKTN